MTLNFPNFHVPRGSVGYFCYQEVHTYDTASTMWGKWMHVHHVSDASLESWVCSVCGKDVLPKCNTGGIFPKAAYFLTSTLSWYTEETVLMCTSHAQTRTAAWSKPFPGPEQFPQPAGCHPHGWQSVCYIHCSKHLGQALPAFSHSGQKFKYCIKWIKN